MRLFRETALSDTVRGESQVWCFECDPGAAAGEDKAAWEIFSGACRVIDILHWNDGADRDGVVMLVDSAEVPKLKAAMSDVRAAIKNLRNGN